MLWKLPYLSKNFFVYCIGRFRKKRYFLKKVDDHYFLDKSDTLLFFDSVKVFLHNGKKYMEKRIDNQFNNVRLGEFVFTKKFFSYKKKKKKKKRG